MQFSLQVGLTLRSGARTLELVRELEQQQYQFEDVLTRRPLVIDRAELISKIFNKEYEVIVADRKNAATAATGPVTVDLSTLTLREGAVLRYRYDYVKGLERKKISKGQRQKIAGLIQKIAEKEKHAKVPSTSAVMRWARNYQASGCNPMALVDKHRFSKRKTRLVEAVDELIKKVLKREYFTRAQHTLRHAYDQLQGDLSSKIKSREITAEQAKVSYSTLARRVQEVDLYNRIASREGTARARIECRTTFPDGVPEYPLERVEIDHTPMNWVVICDRTGLPLGRPVLTIAIDAYSGYVLGFYLSFYGPGLTSVCGVVRNSLMPKESIVTAAGLQNAWLSHGLADEWVVDNGLEFHSFGFKSMAMSLGVDLTYSRVRTPWIKPHVERFFSTLNTLTLTKGRVHKRVANSMNVDPYKDAAICFSDLVQGLMQFFVDVHPFEVNWRKMARPYDLFKEGLERCLPAIYPGDLQQLKLASGMRKMLTFGHGGIEMEGLPYGSVDFKQLANRHGTGLKLLCKFDPDEVSKLYVQEPESLSWIEAQCRWKHYAEGLSYNQHRLIRKFGRAEFKSSDALENLQRSKLRLHEHWMTSTRAGKRADSLLAAQFANLTSSRVIASDSGATPQIPPQPTPSENQLILPESGDVEIKDVPDFETLVM